MLRFLTAGSVDDGKSTLIGRLLFETNGVYEDQLESISRISPSGSNSLDLSLVTDGLKAEREQAITIDVAYRYFSTSRRKFIIADCPGHEQYTRNMVTGASNADAAVLLVDARKGVSRQTRKHAYIIWLLGIRRLIVAANKMDLVDFEEQIFSQVRKDFTIFSRSMDGIHTCFVPVSALTGDNIVVPSLQMPWYAGPSLLQLLEAIPVERDRNLSDMRFPVQIVARHNDFRGYAGQLASGSVRPGQEVLALPSRQTTTIQDIFLCRNRLPAAFPLQSVTLTLSDNIDLGRGDMLVEPESIPYVTNRLLADVIWMSPSPLRLNAPYLIKHTTQTLCCSVLSLLHRLDVDSLREEASDTLALNEIGAVELQTHKPIFFDSYTANHSTGSFILIEPTSNETVAAGLISGPSCHDGGAWTDGQPLGSSQTGTHPRGLTVWFTGLSGAGKTTICASLCTELLARGFRVEVLDGDIVRKLFSTDLGFSKQDRDENVRRIGFIAELLTRNGAVVLACAISPYRSAREEVRNKINDFLEVYVNAPLAVCEERDPKGLYKKARCGEIRGFTGIDDPYEPPLAAEVECKTDIDSVRACTDKVLAAVLRFFSEMREKSVVLRFEACQ